MHSKIKITIFVVRTLTLIVFMSELAVACPSDLVCGNFTHSDKIETCEQVVDLDYDYEQEQEVLCTLWDQGYNYKQYEFPEYPPIDTDLTLDYEEVGGNRISLAFNVSLFLLFNYAVFSILTKPAVVRKWLS